jgi:predicted ATP-dependent endonuclease of OLD family
MKVTKLVIKKFRHLSNLELSFGRRITAIAGQNCTGKSSLLGLVGHVFTFDDSYKTLDNKQFATQYSEIFRFSYPDYDKPKDHDYNVELDDGDVIPVLSYERIEEGKEKTLRIVVGKKEKGEGKRELPVIYLGLKRLFPLAQEKSINQSILSDLSHDEIMEYQSLHNEILILNELITPQFIRVRNKAFYAAKTDVYDSLGNSAGQDNLGQILTSILSLSRLKNSLLAKYQGGMLLVDEIDAALYPAAQAKLIEKLFRIAQDLDLQIIFTTHSLDILETLMQPKYRHDSKVIYLTGARGGIRNVQDEVTITQIINDLRVLAPRTDMLEKISLFCEDYEANLWIKNLLGTSITRYLAIISDTWGADELARLSQKKVPVFKRSIFVLDGDKSSSLKNSRCPRIIFLPGNERPENVFYKFLGGLDPDDEFWGGVGGYTKQVCFRDCPEIHPDRNVMKEWFRNQKPYWGSRGCSKLFNRWKKINPEAVIQFRTNFLNILDKLHRNSDQ